MYFGVGQWTKITKSGRLPGKTQAQIFLQTQRMLGQQSLAEFKGLRLHIDEVFAANKKRDGLRKNGGILINTGNNATPAEVARKLEENRKLYALSEEELANLELPPRPIDPLVERQRQLARLHRLRAVLEFSQEREARLSQVGGDAPMTSSGDFAPSVQADDPDTPMADGREERENEDAALAAALQAAEGSFDEDDFLDTAPPQRKRGASSQKGKRTTKQARKR